LETCTLSNTDDGIVRLLQISDTHLFADAGRDLLGIATAASFQAVLDAITELPQPYDVVLATGDLSQDHSAASYQRFAQEVTTLQKPVHWLPGNHDHRVLMQNELQVAGIHPEMQLVGEHWQVILLDSQVYGTPHGWLSHLQLEQLEAALLQYPEKHALICLHHHTFPIGSIWLDQHDLKNSSDFLTLLSHHPQVKAVLCGHVHQEYDQMHQGIRFLTSPSTCIQFKPLSVDFSLDTMSPGWRYLQLYPDGRLATQVWRLDPGQFVPDLKSTGY
jgi:Icc protein